MGLNWIWLLFLVFVFALDIFTSSFTFSWLGVGFVVAFIVGFYTDFIVQVALAVLIGTVSILFGIKVTKKYVKGKIPAEKLMVGKFVNKQFIADFDLGPNDECRTKVNEVYWAVRNVGDPIKKGDRYTILKIDENKLVIKK